MSPTSDKTADVQFLLNKNETGTDDEAKSASSTNNTGNVKYRSIIITNSNSHRRYINVSRLAIPGPVNHLTSDLTKHFRLFRPLPVLPPLRVRRHHPPLAPIDIVPRFKVQKVWRSRQTAVIKQAHTEDLLAAMQPAMAKVYRSVLIPETDESRREKGVQEQTATEGLRMLWAGLEERRMKRGLPELDVTRDGKLDFGFMYAGISRKEQLERFWEDIWARRGAVPPQRCHDRNLGAKDEKLLDVGERQRR